jgi:hypothetical protein
VNEAPQHIPPHHYAVAFRGGPLHGKIRPIYDKTFEHKGWRHGVPSKGESGNGGVIWSYAHRWPTGCPRYVLTPGDPITAEWRPITDAEFEAGEAAEAAWRHWEKVLRPFEFAGDVAFHARKTAERKGVTDPKMLRLVADNAVVAFRHFDQLRLESFLAGATIPDEVRYVGDARGNMHVRVEPGRARWFQPAPDAYTAYPDRHVWIPPIRNTSTLLAKGPLTVVSHDFITLADRVKLDALRALAVDAEAARV